MKPMVVVVVGMHRSGTSLVSSILHTFGVRMGEAVDLERHDPYSQPQGYWEDQSFTAINRVIILNARSHWHKPVRAKDYVRSAREGELEAEMRALVARKDEAFARENEETQSQGGPRWIGWGFKDPRTSLLIPCWWPILANRRVLFVWTKREPEGVADSLIRRGEFMGGTPKDRQVQAWLALNNLHNQRIGGALKRLQIPYHTVWYEELMARGDISNQALYQLASYIGLQGPMIHSLVREGRERIVFKR